MAPRRRVRSGRGAARRRFVHLLLATCTGLCGLAVVYATTARAAAARPRTVTVRPGQTLWQLSERLAPDEDPRRWIYDVERLNHRSSAVIFPGQVLRLPGP